MGGVLGTPTLSVIAPHDGKAFIFDGTYHIYHEVGLGADYLVVNEVLLDVHEFATVDQGTRALYWTTTCDARTLRPSDLQSRPPTAVFLRNVLEVPIISL